MVPEIQVSPFIDHPPCRPSICPNKKELRRLVHGPDTPQTYIKAIADQ